VSDTPLSYLTYLTRREAITRLGFGAALGLGAGFGGRSAAALGAQPAFTSAQKLSFPANAVIRTVLKDVPPEALANGATLFHEHLVNMNYGTPPPAAGQRPATESPEPIDLLVDEVRAAGRDGAACLVDAAFRGRRRPADLDALSTIAARSGVHILMAGGYWRAPYPEGVAQKSEDELADEITTDARELRWGAFGEIGTSIAGIHPDERKVLRAICKAHLRTGLPIFSHIDHKGCPQCALDQMEVFEAAGVNVRALCIGHLSDLTPEQDPGWQTHKTIAKRGAFVGLDTVGRALALTGVPDIPEAHKVKMVLSMLDAGYGITCCFRPTSPVPSI
jgi:predicted metal-dependent phosphotriesterase family hydrolase